jgi:hypothetical protein
MSTLPALSANIVLIMSPLPTGPIAEHHAVVQMSYSAARS